MDLNIELPYEVETRLREQAQQKGKPLNQYVESLIREKIEPLKTKTTALTAEETLLFQIINKGFSADFWSNLQRLDERRKEAQLSETERIELVTSTEALEAANVERMKALIELAALRQTDLDTLMAHLGLKHGNRH